LTIFNQHQKAAKGIIDSEFFGADYFASNPLLPADGTANETSQEPDWSSVSVREKLICLQNE